MTALSAELAVRWRQDGFLSPFPLLSVEEVQVCRAGVERFETWLGGRINAVPDMKWRTMPHLILPWAAKLARDPRIMDVVEGALGPDILIYTSTFFIKEPRSATIAAWHQDSTYFGLEPKEAATVWIALTDAGEVAGCMEALPVRGRLRQLQHNSRIVENSVNRASQIIIEPLDEGTPVGMPLQVGSFSMHHGLCPHRSGPNNSDHRRIGFALICIPTHVRPVGSVRPTAMLARGSDRHGNFELVEPPKSELDVDGLTVHERAVGLYRDAYLEEEVRHNRFPA